MGIIIAPIETEIKDTWYHAVLYGIGLSVGKYKKWRLPTIQEFSSIDFNQCDLGNNREFYWCSDKFDDRFTTSSNDLLTPDHAYIISIYSYSIAEKNRYAIIRLVTDEED